MSNVTIRLMFNFKEKDFFMKLLLLVLLLLPMSSHAATQSVPVSANISDGAGNAITSQSNGSQRAVDVGVNVSGVQVDPRSIRALTSSDVVTSNIKDSAGASVTVGQKAMANSLPVVISSDQTSFPVTLSPTFFTRSDTFTTVTNGTTVDAHLAPVKYFTISVFATGAVTSWTVVLEGSLDNVNFTPILSHTNVSPGTGVALFGGTTATPVLYFRSRTSALTLGGGTNVISTILGM